MKVGVARPHHGLKHIGDFSYSTGCGRRKCTHWQDLRSLNRAAMRGSGCTVVCAAKRCWTGPAILVWLGGRLLQVSGDGVAGYRVHNRIANVAAPCGVPPKLNLRRRRCLRGNRIWRSSNGRVEVSSSHWKMCLLRAVGTISPTRRSDHPNCPGWPPHCRRAVGCVQRVLLMQFVWLGLFSNGVGLLGGLSGRRQDRSP